MAVLSPLVGSRADRLRVAFHGAAADLRPYRRRYPQIGGAPFARIETEWLRNYEVADPMRQ